MSTDERDDVGASLDMLSHIDDKLNRIACALETFVKLQQCRAQWYDGGEARYRTLPINHAGEEHSYHER